MFSEIDKMIEGLKVRAGLSPNSEAVYLAIHRLERAKTLLEKRNEENEKRIEALAEIDE